MSTNWRSLASELDAVIKVAAVNCEEDWTLCRKEGISSYPSLVLYPSVSFVFLAPFCGQVYLLFFFFNVQKEKYYGERTPEDMQNFVLHKLHIQPVEISNYKLLKNTLEDSVLRSSPWLFIFCKDASDSNCPSWQSRVKLAYIFVSQYYLK